MMVNLRAKIYILLHVIASYWHMAGTYYSRGLVHTTHVISCTHVERSGAQKMLVRVHLRAYASDVVETQDRKGEVMGMRRGEDRHSLW